MRRHKIISLAVLLIAVLGICVIWEAGRCEVVLTRNKVPLKAGRIHVSMCPPWDGDYTLDDSGKWNMGWHFSKKPGNLYITIADTDGQFFEGFFEFPIQSGWTVDFSGRTTTRARSVNFLFFHTTESFSWTSLTPTTTTTQSSPAVAIDPQDAPGNTLPTPRK